MKQVCTIELSNEIILHGDRSGYCEEIGRYVLKHLRAFVCGYYAFYFLTEDQFDYLRKKEEEFQQDREAYLKWKYETVKIGSPIGAEYIRDYNCSLEFRSEEGSPLPSRWDGPYLYDGKALLWDFFTDGVHYGVPVIDFNHRCGSGEGFRIYYYDKEGEISFLGKPVSLPEGTGNA